MVSVTNITQKQWLKAMKKLGLEVDKKKVKGSHARIFNPNNKKATTVPNHCHKFINLGLYKVLLEWDYSEEEIDNALK